MSSQVLGPFSFTGGAPFTVTNWPPGTWRWAVISNLSPIPVQIDNAEWLNPNIADLFDITAAKNYFFVNPVGNGTGQLLVTLYDPDEVVNQGAYPQSATGGALTFRPTNLVAGAVAIPSAGNVTKVYALNPNARALTFASFRTGGAGLLTITVTGVTTGIVYASFIPALSGSRPALNHVEVNPAIDPSFSVNYTTPAGTSFNVWVAQEYDPMVMGIESLPDTFNVIVELVQKTPTESRVVCTHNANTRIVAAGAAGYNRGFEVQVPYGTAVDANGVSCLVNLGAAATATLGKGLVPGGFYARSDYNGDIDVWNTSATTDFSIDLTVWF